MKENYFDLNFILRTQQKTKCKLLYPLSTADGTAILGTTNSNVELPLWLAEKLGGANKCVEIDPMPIFKKYMRNLLEADPLTIDLKDVQPYFYSIGLFLIQKRLLPDMDEAQNLIESIQKCFTLRFVQLALSALSTTLGYSGPASIGVTADQLDSKNILMEENIIYKLDFLEEHLYTCAKNNSILHELWLNNHPKIRIIPPSKYILLDKNKRHKTKKLKQS